MSVNGGKSFSAVSSGAHGDFHAVWIDPENSNIVYAGDDGGLWRSQDGGTRWLHQVNLPVSQFYHVSVDNADPYRVYGGLQDNSSWVGDSSYPGGVSYSRWENMFGGDGFWMFEDPSDPGLPVCRSAGRRNRASEPLYAREARDHAVSPNMARSKLRFNWNTPIHMSPDREGHDLHRRAVSVSLARSRPVVAAHLARPDDQRSARSRSRKSRAALRWITPRPKCTPRSTPSANRPRTARSSGLVPMTETCRSRTMAERHGRT